MDIFALNNCNFASGVKFTYLSKLSKAWSLPSYLAINSAVNILDSTKDGPDLI